jgi:hypothetical protein
LETGQLWLWSKSSPLLVSKREWGCDGGVLMEVDEGGSKDEADCVLAEDIISF